jgi:protein-disulfide isomerase
MPRTITIAVILRGGADAFRALRELSLPFPRMAEREEQGKDRDEKRDEAENGDDGAREEAIRQGKDDAARRAEGLEEDHSEEDEEDGSGDDEKGRRDEARRGRDDERDEDEDEDEDDRKSRKWPKVLAALAALLAIVVVAVVVMGGDEQKPKEPTTTTERKPVEGPIIGATAVENRYRGIEQDEFGLGQKDAPVTLVMFGDLQCPLCRDAVENAIPPLVDRYVKTGRLRIEFRNYVVLPPDSEKAAKALEAAAAQNRAWQFIELWYLNQGEENSGYVTDDFIRRVGRAAKGLDVEQLVVASNAEAAGRSTRVARSDAEEFGIDSAPAFLIGPTGEQLAQLQITSPDDPGQYTQAVDRLLIEQDVEGGSD